MARTQIGPHGAATPAAPDDHERTERLATLGTLAGAIAHEFNNLLTPVMSYAQMALSSPEDRELATKALQKAVEGAERAAAAASSILGFIRGDEVHMVHVGHALRDALGCLAREPVKDGIQLEVDVPEDAWVAMSPVRLQQVLLNLLLNARKAIMPHAGTIAVIARCSTWNTPPTTTHAPEAQRRGVVEIVVRDTGCGMPESLVARAFEPFVRTRSVGGAPGSQGTGLGLSICHRIIEDSGGMITIESVEGEGTTVRIVVPHVDPGAVDMPAPPIGSTWNIGPAPSTPTSRAA